MRASLPFLLVLALLAGSVPVASQGGAFTILVKGAQAEFLSDSWKDEQPLTGDGAKTTPLPSVPNLIGTYRNPYFGAPHASPAGPANGWGYALNLTLELGDPNRIPIRDAALNLFLEARIETGFGVIPAKLQKLAPSSFRATFDLDGEAGKPWPALFGGPATVLVDVFESTPGSQPRKIGSDVVTFRTSFGLSNVPAVAFPRDAFQIYSDLGNVTPLATAAYSPEDTVPITFAFGVANENVRVVALNTRALKTVHEGRTDTNGAVTFDLKLADVLGTAQGGLVVVEAHLLGSPQSMVFGNGLVVLPVQSHATAVTAVTRETRAPGADPAATVRVTVSDPDAGPTVGGRHGRVLALDGARVLANVPFLPIEPGQSGVNQKFARYLAAPISSAGVSSYTIYSLLFTERNEFYSIATATRGYAIGAAPVEIEQGERGILRLSVRNLNANGDAQSDYGLATTVQVRVTNLPNGGNWTGEVSLAEAGTNQSFAMLEIPFSTGTVGGTSVVINSTADELTLDRTASIAIREPPGAFRGLLDRLTPGPGILLVAAAAVALALVARRR